MIDNFRNESNWHRTHDWGWYHPEQLWQYNSERHKIITPDGISLRALPIYKVFDSLAIPNMVECLFSKFTIKPPFYIELICQLPKANGAFPAFWIYGGVKDKPAIMEWDIFEQVPADLNTKCKRLLVKHNFKLPYRVETNVHSNATGMGKGVAHKIKDKTWHAFGFSLNETEANYFYNDKLVRTETNPALIKEAQIEYHVVVNTAYHDVADKEPYLFKVKEFTYEPINN